MGTSHQSAHIDAHESVTGQRHVEVQARITAMEQTGRQPLPRPWGRHTGAYCSPPDPCFRPLKRWASTCKLLKALMEKSFVDFTLFWRQLVRLFPAVSVPLSLFGFSSMNSVALNNQKFICCVDHWPCATGCDPRHASGRRSERYGRGAFRLYQRRFLPTRTEGWSESLRNACICFKWTQGSEVEWWCRLAFQTFPKSHFHKNKSVLTPWLGEPHKHAHLQDQSVTTSWLWVQFWSNNFLPIGVHSEWRSVSEGWVERVAAALLRALAQSMQRGASAKQQKRVHSASTHQLHELFRERPM